MRLLTFGESMGLAVNDDAGAISMSRGATLSFGGAESNVAIAVARLGVDVTWVSRLGADPFGSLITRELRAENVTVIAAVDPDRTTGFMLKERRSASVASVTYWRSNSAASALSSADISDDMLSQSDLLHVSGITPALSESARSATLDSVRRAREAGIPVSMDINHRELLWSAADAADTYRQLVEASTLVFASDHEAAIVVGSANAETLAERLSDLGPTDAIIKLGGKGCVARIAGTTYAVPALEVDAVDTVGAGDAFVGAYLAEWLAGSSPLGRLHTAVAAGGIACTSRGDWESSPTRLDVERFFRSEGVTR